MSRKTSHELTENDYGDTVLVTSKVVHSEDDVPEELRPEFRAIQRDKEDAARASADYAAEAQFHYDRR